MQKKVKFSESDKKSLTSILKNLASYSLPFTKDSFGLIDSNCFKDKNDGQKFYGLYDNLMKKLSSCLEKKQLYPATEILSILLFYIIKNNFNGNTLDTVGVFQELTEQLNYTTLVDDVFIVHPLSDFGFKYDSDSWFLRRYKKEKLSYFICKDFIVFPQANCAEQLIENIGIAFKHFHKKTGGFNRDIINDFLKNDNFSWLQNNPVLIQKMNFSRTNVYDNREHIIWSLENKIILLTLVSFKFSKDNGTYSSSTKYVNNWQTYDEYHYLIFSHAQKKAKYKLDYVPRLDKLSAMFDVFRLNIELNATYSDSETKWIKKINNFIHNALSESNVKSKSFFAVLRTSLGYFVRSIQTEYSADKVLFLCIAFESLLGEKCTDNIQGHIINNLRFFINASDDDEKYFKELYNSRSGIAHEGKSRGNDTSYCASLYIKVIEKLIDIYESGETFTDEKFFSNYSKKILKKKLGFILELK